MSGISMLGMGSGIDIDRMLNAVMAPHKEKLNPYIAEQAQNDKKISAYGKFRAELDKLQKTTESLMKFDKITTTSVSREHKTLFVSSDEKAVPGSYDVIVEKLAQAQSLKTSSIDDAKKKLGGTVAAGQERILVIEQASEKEPLQIKLTDEQTSLTAIRDAINSADSNVTASLVKINDNAHQLILTSKKTGKESEMNIKVTGDNILNNILHYDPTNTANNKMTETVAAENAVVKINGIEIERSSNEIKDAPEGVTFTLLKVAENDPNVTGNLIAEKITISKDNGPIKKAIKEWVDAFNNLQSYYQNESKFVATKPNDDKPANSGILLNDSPTSLIFSQVKGLLLNTQPVSDMRSLGIMGITLNHEGKLTIDDKKLDNALKDNPSKVKEFFMGDGKTTGFATESFNYLKETLDEVDGSLHFATQSLDKQKQTINKKIDDIKSYISSKFEFHKKQFIELDQTLAKLNQDRESLANLITKA